MSAFVLVAAIIFLANLSQSVVGFGSGLIAMALLPGVIGLRAAAPMFALLGIVAEIVILVRNWRDLRLAAVARLIGASLLGIPFGIVVLGGLPEQIVLRALGVVLIAYGLYGLARLRLPEIRDPRWAYVFGWTAGILSGAYNVGGPPVVIYATCRRWTPAEFRSNLQSFFMFNSAAVIVSHGLAGHYTPEVLAYAAAGLPALVAALAVGFAISRAIPAERFRRLVFVLLLALGVRLLVGG